MIKRILIALDPDVDTQVATIYGIELARTFNASITGLAVVDSHQVAAEVSTGDVGSMYYAEELREFMNERTRKEAGKLLAAFEETVSTAGVKHGEIMEEGVPHERIIEDMKFHDLLVIGRDSHFYYNRADKKTGTLTQVIKEGVAPTLVAMKSYHEVKRAMIAFDGSSPAAKTLQMFVQLQPFGKELPLELVQVSTGHAEHGRDRAKLLLRLAEDYLHAHGFKKLSKTILNGNNHGESLLHHQKQTSADIIVLGAHARSAISRMVFGSTTHYLLSHSTVPLFMCN